MGDFFLPPKYWEMIVFYQCWISIPLVDGEHWVIVRVWRGHQWFRSDSDCVSSLHPWTKRRQKQHVRKVRVFFWMDPVCHWKGREFQTSFDLLCLAPAVVWVSRTTLFCCALQRLSVAVGLSPRRSRTPGARQWVWVVVVEYSVSTNWPFSPVWATKVVT